MKKRALIPYAERAKCAWAGEFFPERSILALTVAGKAVVEYWLDECRRDGVAEALILDWEYDEQVVKLAGDGRRWALKLEYHGYAGTGDAEELGRRYAKFFGEGEAEVQRGCRLAGVELDSLGAWFGLNFAMMEAPGRHVLPGYAAKGGLRTGMNAAFGEGVEVEGNAYVGDGSRLGDGCRLRGGAVVGKDCIIGAGCELRRTVVMDNTSVGDGLELTGKAVWRQRIIDVESGTYADVEEAGLAAGTDGKRTPGAVSEAEFLGNRYTAAGDEATERKLARTLAEISREVASLHLAFLKGVYLGGGYGRGEGAAPLANDLDFFVLTGRADKGQLAMAAAALEAIGMEQAEKCGVHVDFCKPRPAAGFKKDEERLMMQELARGHVTVWGDPEGLRFLRRLPANELPAMEAVRLLVNRGMGLGLARQEGRSAEFRERNVNKAVLGAYDALLVSRRRYEWRAADRAEALGEELYRKALECKAKGSGAACGWGEARDLWAAAADETMREHGNELELWKWRHEIRWILRRKTLGIGDDFGTDPLMRILRPLRKLLGEAGVEGPLELPAKMIKDWEVFN